MMINSLPKHLSERTRVVERSVALENKRPQQPHSIHRKSEFVLYWMHHAVRASENPALDVAREAARRLDLPLLVYQGLAGGHQYNSDRHHTFIMEGARDVAVALDAIGVRHAFHLGSDSKKAAPLQALAARAAIVVTDDFPVHPFPNWTRQLASKTAAEVWLVDTACIFPMKQTQRAYARAFEFRQAFGAELNQRAILAWPSCSGEAKRFAGSLGFEAADLANADLGSLCAQCDIDHSIGPVTETRGGTVAGEARWNSFVAYGLADYDKLRNDPAIDPPRGVSRISPYLHHGHLSPFKVAREAALHDSSGAQKFCDELLIWRELAHAECFHHNASVHTLSALPQWAQETLENHADDPRQITHSWEEFTRGETQDTLWNAAQASLRIHGQLHNNIRMTWGKAPLGWTRNPQQALDMMIDLNNRYALDGTDPNSYGGLLYCLGLFDRPFKPEQPIWGTVRTRSSAVHSKRLDLQQYQRRLLRGEKPKIGIIGGGISGLAAARTLSDQGFSVTVFDKSRGVGGRSASRRANGYSFDHGAQYFTARNPLFRRYVDSWIERGVVAEWGGRIVDLENPDKAVKGNRFVGIPGMSALAKHLAASIDVRLGASVIAARRTHGAWALSVDGHDEPEHCDILIMAVPPEQAKALLKDYPALAEEVNTVSSLPCWSAMVAFDQNLDLNFDAAFVNKSRLSWIARDSSKPGRGSGERWVLHANPEWSARRLQSDSNEVAAELLQDFFAVTGAQVQTPAHLAGHRWGLARTQESLGKDCIWRDDIQLAVCGDWCRESKIEGAFLSGTAAAGRIAGAHHHNARNVNETDYVS